tara:strand:+ start:295 stop:969 length:675 start_codon:yes stop_codon:yes gene_type:complete
MNTQFKISNKDCFIFSNIFQDKMYAVLTKKSDKRSFNLDNLAISKKIANPIQVHSDKVKLISKPGIYQNVDGLITMNKDIILTLKVADCIPIFLANKDGNVFGLIHAGWKGVAQRIIINALNIFINEGVSYNDIIVFLGPSINECCFEVGKDVANKFSNKFVITKGNRLYVDLKKNVYTDLLSFGIPKLNINISNVCTYESNECLSFRRDKTKKRMNAFFGYNK